MNLSRKWLNEFVKIDAPDREFAEAMTLSGSKVEGSSVSFIYVSSMPPIFLYSPLFFLILHSRTAAPRRL